MRRGSPAGIETLPPVCVPEGYGGKILLLAVTGGPRSQTVLRSGGRWHRDILRACEAEIRALGLPGVSLAVRGGAHLRFQADGSLLLWGRSEEFGACDYHEAALLLKRRWPARKIIGPWGEMP